MDDYAALVERVCFTLPKVTGCLLLSEDGLVLSAYPDDGNNVAETAWLHFCALGEPLRGFLAFADQVWAYVRHGPYAAFVVAGAGVRPGVLVDQLEQVLTNPRIRLPAETFHAPDPPRPTPPAAATPEPPRSPPPPAPTPDLAPESEAESVAEPEAEPEAEVIPEVEHEDPAEEGSRTPVNFVDRAEDEEGEIDRVLLAQEFSGLLQMHRADDEASS
jgi:hypothetical protein